MLRGFMEFRERINCSLFFSPWPPLDNLELAPFGLHIHRGSPQTGPAGGVGILIRVKITKPPFAFLINWS